MSNPWEEIELSDYENHMSLDHVYQLQMLNKMMREQFNDYDIDTIMVLGIAGGNGLEHINKEQIKKVYGVDINYNFLEECKRRYHELGDIFETICVDLLDDNLQLPQAELLVANLLVEYIGYACFQKVIRLVKPLYVSCIIQVNTGDSFVSDSPYIRAFDCLEEVHHQIEENSLVEYMNKINYQIIKTAEQVLPNGKKFVRLDFVRNTSMLKLRPYKLQDAETIITWCKDEVSFRKWTSDRYETFPITADDMNYKYIECNGDCVESDNFYPFTAFDENGIVGHMIMRYTDADKTTLRFGFVIVDDSKRGKGYGKEMLRLALKCVFEVFGAEKVTLGVFENNAPAYYCYKAAGFKDVEMEKEIRCEICGEMWKVLELVLTRQDYENL